MRLFPRLQVSCGIQKLYQKFSGMDNAISIISLPSSFFFVKIIFNYFLSVIGTLLCNDTVNVHQQSVRRP